ncbi:MAG TPA: TIGR03032 family protein [Bryobacteraceae bacterium]|nr:TIGR03032 family protein [Bryobacteraceae bacterium]
MEFRYSQSDSFVALLKQLSASLLVTTYRANKLLVLREQHGGLSILVRTFDRPMGLAADSRRIALGTRDQVWQFRNAPDLARQVEPRETHDACFLPRSSHVTGDIGIHEIAWAGKEADELWLVNTRFSCLCTLDPGYSFVPRWRPPFITALAAEDRCHLNGMAIVDGRPRYVTALGRTNVRGGWRAGKACGGALMSVPDGEVIVDGLCMPHSPRWHDKTLWVLESGTGKLLRVDPTTRAKDVVTVELPGFARGVGIHAPYAFIGLSKIRATSAMDGVPLAGRRAELKCGIAAVDLRTGRVVAMVDFQTAVEEIFDVQGLAGNRFPEVLGFQKETIQHTFVVPPARSDKKIGHGAKGCFS